MDIQKEILKMIQKATETCPVKRDTLNQTFKIHDREMRGIISYLKQKYPICNFQDSRGYFMAKTQAQAMKQYKQEQSRINKIRASLKGLEPLMRGKNYGLKTKP